MNEALTPMHTTHELSVGAFEYRRDGERVDRGAVLPPVALSDRVGVVTADPADGLGAGNLLLDWVTGFYELLRERREEFFEYPDYYTFQPAAEPLDYLEFDVWPDHKNVSVPDDPEGVLRAVNDRAVNVLLVPDDPGPDPEITDVARRSAERRVDACFAYAPDGTLADPGFSVRLPRSAVREWYEDTAAAAGVEPLSYADTTAGDGMLAQGFRRIDLEEALRRLPGGE